VIVTLAVREKARRRYPALGGDAFETAVVLLGLQANDAQAAYGDCSDLFVREEPFTGNGVVNKLGRFVCRDLDSSTNPEMHRQAIEAFARYSSILKIREAVLAL
jgi:hypothetical protein